ncbi:dehydrin Xero 1-like [Carica papaya]|uniref:dehydrin Xero 1-like n=1 Tax=Carica papaya TaxID=3649 RepID=UPI000B8D0C47|nr:dehydrin Xero 1-like [Carica papaya]
MAQYQNQYGAVPTPTAESTNLPTTQTDEYGNPIGGTSGTHMQTTAGHHKEHHGLSGIFHRSGSSSSSSSSSEDDGHGGRRKKKGLKEKVKEKLPGMRPKDEQTPATATTTPYDAGVASHQPKKGVMEKIKEKLTRHH